MTAALLGEANSPHRYPVEGEHEREQRVREVDRKQEQQPEAERSAEHPAGGRMAARRGRSEQVAGYRPATSRPKA